MAGTDATGALPVVPLDITAQWLGSKLGHKVRSIENTRSIWGTATKLFYTITYEEDGGKVGARPTHVCIKGVFDPEMIEAQPWTVSLARREAEFFSEVAPHVGDMIFPKGWWVGSSERQGIAIMSDLTAEGCSFAGEAASYPVEKVMNGIEQLAGLHARYWGEGREGHPWIWHNYEAAMIFMCASWHDVVRRPGRPRLPEYLMDGRRCNETMERYYAERNPRFRTLLHGDTHIGNIYFTAEGRIGFLDWSAFHFGSCFHDIVYFMTTMLSVEDRRAHEMEILDRYLGALHRLGGPRFDRNDPEVMIEYRRSFMSNSIWIICPDGLQSRERVAALCERTVAAYDDHGVVDLILGQPKPATAAT